MRKLHCRNIVKAQQLCLHSFRLSVSDVPLGKVIFNTMICKTAAKMSFYSTTLGCDHAGGTREQDEVQLKGDNLLNMQFLILCCDRLRHFHTPGLLHHIFAHCQRTTISEINAHSPTFDFSSPNRPWLLSGNPSSRLCQFIFPHPFF